MKEAINDGINDTINEVAIEAYLNRNRFSVEDISILEKRFRQTSVSENFR